MNKFHILSIFCFIIGTIFFTIGFVKGEIEAGLILIFPYISGKGLFALLSFMTIFIGIIFFLVSFIYYSNMSFNKFDKEFFPEKSYKKSIKGGGVVLIGPIPIIFGSSWKIAIIMMILAIITIIVAFLL